MPAYRLAELWSLPFDLSVSLIRADEELMPVAAVPASKNDEPEQRRLPSGKYEPKWAASLRTKLGG